MNGFFDMQLAVGGLAIALGVWLVMALASLIFAEEAKKRKKKKYCMVLAGAAACVWLAALIVFAPRAHADTSGFYHRVTFPNNLIPTSYQPYTIYTNNGTNAGYSTPVTVSVTNATIWTSSYYQPSNLPQNAVYIGRDWLPGVPVTIELGVYVPNVAPGTQTNSYLTNWLAFSPDGNYWTPSNTYQVGGLLLSNLIQGTNWFYATVPTSAYSNMVWAAWDGIQTLQTNGVTVIYFGYAVPHPTF